jgi:hypothetical protein
MRSSFFALTFTALSVVWCPTAPALAQGAKVARGTVAEIGGRWVIVKVGDNNMKFDVDSKTSVEARGASAKVRLATVSGKSGPHLDELLKVGQAVAVTYDGMAGSPRATRILAISNASVSNGPAAMTSEGVVKAVGVDTITINGSSGGAASFEQTFTIDRSTKVFAKGAGTATAAKGGKAPFAEFVASGDRVSVSYHRMGNALVASDVHVTMKASH